GAPHVRTAGAGVVSASDPGRHVAVAVTIEGHGDVTVVVDGGAWKQAIGRPAPPIVERRVGGHASSRPLEDHGGGDQVAGIARVCRYGRFSVGGELVVADLHRRRGCRGGGGRRRDARCRGGSSAGRRR